MGKRHEQALLQKRHTNGQQTHEKMVNVTWQHGNTIQNHVRYPTSHLSEWLKLTSQETRDVGEGVEKGEPSHIVGRNASWCSHSGRQYGGYSKS